MKKYLSIFLIISLLFVSCDSNKIEGNNFTEEKKLKVGVFLYRNDDFFIQSLKDSIEEIVSEKYADWDDVSFNFFDGKNQNEIQIKQIREAIESKYDVLVINIVERSSATKIIDMAKKADIPILFFNRQPLDVDMARWDKLYYVGLNGSESGKMQGEIVSEYWKSHPEMDKNGDGILQYVMLQGQYNHQDTILRSKYSIEAIKEAGIYTEELYKETANWQRTEADNIMAESLNVFGDRIELVIANNDMMALGALDAIKRKKMNNIAIVGVDGAQPAVEALNNNEIIGTVLNDNKKQGRIITKIAVTLARDEDVVKKFPEMESATYYWIEYQKISN